MKAPARGPSSFRVGTWNLAGRWSPGHRPLLEAARCDAWSLTEVPPASTSARPPRLVGPDGCGSSADVGRGVVGGASVPVASPHPAVAAAVVDGLLLCSCVLPWRGAGVHWPGDGDDAARTVAALDAIAPLLAGHAGTWSGAATGTTP